MVFPPGAHVGMKPLVGLVRAKSFIGFETEDQGVKVLIADLPADAYNEVVTAFKANPAGTGNIKPESLETRPASPITPWRARAMAPALCGVIP